jgi:cell wall-associated NlpC family hydrolase
MPPLFVAPSPAHASTHAALRARIVRIARSFIGTPYVWAGASRGGVDCSGLVYAVFRRMHVRLEHSSYALWADLRHVRRPRPGDLVFFGDGPSHVGIYIGGDRFIHAPGTGDHVRYGHLHGPDRHPGYIGAARVVD